MIRDVDHDAVRVWLKTLESDSEAIASLSHLKSGPPVDATWYGFGATKGYDFARDVGDYRSCSILSIGVRWLKRAAMQGELRIGTIEGQDYTPDESHPALQLLSRPNPWQPPKVFYGGIYDSLVYTGEAFAIKVRPRIGGPPSEWYWCPNHQIEVIEDARGEVPISGYRYSYPGGSKPLPPSDVVHLKYEPDPYRWWRGTSPLKQLVASIAGLNNAELWTAGVLKRGHGGTVLVPKERVNTGFGGGDSAEETALRAAQSRLQTDLTGSNAGGFSVLLIPVGLERVGFSPEEMALNVILDRPETNVLAAIGINAHVLALTSSAATQTYENTKTYARLAHENGVIPLQDLLAEDGIQSQLLYVTDPKGKRIPEWPGDSDDMRCWWDRSEIAALKEDANEKANRATSVWTADGMTWNEFRQAVDLPPFEEGDPRGEMYFSEHVQAQQGPAESEEPPSDNSNAEPIEELPDDEPSSDAQWSASRNGRAKVAAR